MLNKMPLQFLPTRKINCQNHHSIQFVLQCFLARHRAEPKLTPGKIVYFAESQPEPLRR